jgi:serine/threonine protein phosphatase 1
MTRYAIGDIHGGSKTFRALLDKLNLKREDRVYLLGDYVDRGPDSKGVLDTIIQMRESGYDLRPVRGNHDDMLLRTIIDDHDEFSWYYVQGWGTETLGSFGVDLPEHIPDRYRRFLEVLPYILEDGSFVFVHASLDMSKDDPITQTSTSHMLWGNGGFISDNDIPGKTIISGHTMRSIDRIQASLTCPHIQIDNGAFSNQQPELGNLVALNLDLMQLTLQPWIDDAAQLNSCINVTSFQPAEETVPLIRDEKVEILIEDEKRAIRIARVMMDDIGQYHPELVKRGINEDNIFELLHDQIEEARMEFELRVSSHLDRTKIFNSAIVNVLIKRAYKHKTKY